MAYPVQFKMTDNSTGTEVEGRTRFVLPSWVQSRTQFTIGYFARIWCEEVATKYFGTDDVSVALITVNGINYAY